MVESLVTMSSNCDNDYTQLTGEMDIEQTGMFNVHCNYAHHFPGMATGKQMSEFDPLLC